MRLDTKPGEFVRFTGEGGYDMENADARLRLKIGDLYEVEQMTVGGWSSIVKLVDYGSFNTVMFDNVRKIEPPPAETARPRHMERGIVAAACRFDDLTLSMPAPARHGDILFALEAIGVDPVSVDQGFLDHRGVYLSRRTAKIVAGQHRQINRAQMEAGGDLFSEDLW